MTTGDDEGFVPIGRSGKIAYEIRGRGHLGPPLLLIRPLGGSMALWGRFRSTLAERHTVISYDPRGSGHSSAGSWGLTTRRLALGAVRVLDHVGAGRAHVFGISLGGMTAQWLALDAPERVECLCLASTTAHGLDLFHAGVRRGLAFAASFAEPSGEVETSLANLVLSRGFRRAHPRAVDRIDARLRTEPASRLELLKHAAAGARHDTRDRLGDIRARTLVLAGAKDDLLGLAPQRALARAIAGAEIEIIERAGHDLTLEEPVATAEHVVRFLERG